MTTETQKPQMRIGGLFRCGLSTLGEMYEEGNLPTDLGSIVKCKHCPEQMILAEDGTWEWLPDDEQ